MGAKRVLAYSCLSILCVTVVLLLEVGLGLYLYKTIKTDFDEKFVKELRKGVCKEEFKQLLENENYLNKYIRDTIINATQTDFCKNCDQLKLTRTRRHTGGHDHRSWGHNHGHGGFRHHHHHHHHGGFHHTNQEDGSPGPPGPPGLPGERGYQGQKGEKGDEGLIGPKGEHGVAGPPGTNQGAGPPGSVGPPGLPGERGFQGQKGDWGLTGPKGQQGLTGQKGETGVSGPKGENGVAGPPGKEGPAGKDGKDGESGKPGQKGEMGVIGLPGERGVSGPPGRNGNSGMPGMTGPIGPPGKEGMQGPKGDKGEQGDKTDTSPIRIVPRISGCEQLNIGQLNFVQTLNDSWTTIMIDSNPLAESDAQKFWGTMKDIPKLFEFNDLKSLTENNPSVTYDLTIPFQGNSHVVYHGSFFYNSENRAEEIIKFDLKLQDTKILIVPGMSNKDKKWYPFDFSVDEYGLWVTFPNPKSDSTSVMKINTDDMIPERTWDVGIQSEDFVDTFVASGVLYTMHYTQSLQVEINYAINLFTDTGKKVNLLGIGNTREITMATYDHRGERIIVLESGKMLVYSSLCDDNILSTKFVSPE